MYSGAGQPGSQSQAMGVVGVEAAIAGRKVVHQPGPWSCLWSGCVNQGYTIITVNPSDGYFRET